MKKTFLSGLILVLPMFIVVWLIYFLYHRFIKPFVHLFEKVIFKYSYLYPADSREEIQEILYGISPIVTVLLLIIAITLLGMLMRLYVFDAIAQVIRKLIDRVPFVGKCYEFCREAIRRAFAKEEKIFDGGYLVQFPMQGVNCIGLKLNYMPPLLEMKVKKSLSAVLVLTAPHPIAGYLVFYPDTQLKKLDVTTENVMKYSMSMGALFETSAPSDK